jgi:hypothetical protein
VRWALRARGILVTGLHPRELIEPVAPAVLRADVREAMREWSTGLACERQFDPEAVHAMTNFLYATTPVLLLPSGA